MGGLLGRSIKPLQQRLKSVLDHPRQATWLAAGATGLAGLLQVVFSQSTFALVFLLLVLLLISQANLRPWSRLSLIGALLLVAVPLAGTQSLFGMTLPGDKNLALIFLFISIFINVVLALGLNLVVGFAGLLDLGYIAFFAGGAYLYAAFGSDHAGKIFTGAADLFPLGGWWFWVCLPLAVAFAAFLGIALGLPVLRLRGDYLAIVTLGFGEIIYVLAKNLDKPINITGGAFGIGNIQPPVLFGYRLEQDIHFYFIGLVLMVLTFIIMSRIERGRAGRAWAAMREDEIAARAMGVQLVRMKLLAFATGASFAGAMGMLFAVKQQFINPDSFTFVESIGILAMVILGGLGSIQGAVIGAVVLTVMRMEVLQRFSDYMQQFNLPPSLDLAKYQPLIFGLILILMMLYRQEGLIPNRRRPEDIDAIERANLPATPGAPGSKQSA